MDFYKVTFEQDVSDLSEKELHELVSEFQDAQEQNIEQFEEIDQTVTEYQEADSELGDELAEVSPLTDEEVDAMGFARKRELLERFSETDSTSLNGDEDGSTENFGKRGEIEGSAGEDETDDMIQEAFSSIPGVQPSE